MPSGLPNNLLVSYNQKGKDAALSVSAALQASIFNIRAYNNSGSTLTVGIVRRLAQSYKVFQQVSGVFTDVTAQLKLGTATAIFSGSNNDGFVIQSKYHHGLIGFTISTAQTGGVFAYQYWNGTAWTTLTTFDVPTDYSSAADTWVAFRHPFNSAVGGVAGLDSTMYSVRIISSTAPAGAVSINKFWIGEFLELVSQVADGSYIQAMFPKDAPYVGEGSESFMPYFGTANAANQFGAYYTSI